MKGVNKAIIVGTCGKDPEIRYNGEMAFCSVVLATEDKWKDKQTGEQKSRTEWHNITFKGKLAEIANEYIKKGSSVYIEGKIQTEKWKDQSGQDRYTTKIHAYEMQLLDRAATGEKPVAKGNRGEPQYVDLSEGFDDSEIPF